MPRYEVIDPCYVPVGSGVRFKHPGQVVTLTAAQADKLTGYVTPVVKPWLVRIPDTAAPSKIKRGNRVTIADESEVSSDAGEPSSVDERTHAEDPE